MRGRPGSVRSLEEFGRVRLSASFFMRDFLHSEIADFHGILNIPETAPAGISPWVTYLERAMSSLRASATIEMRRVRPRSEPTRWRNQQLRALSGWYLTHIQASSTIVVRRRGLPVFEIPCSWSMLPLFHGLGARPA